MPVSMLILAVMAPPVEVAVARPLHRLPVVVLVLVLAHGIAVSPILRGNRFAIIRCATKPSGGAYRISPIKMMVLVSLGSIREAVIAVALRVHRVARLQVRAVRHQAQVARRQAVVHLQVLALAHRVAPAAVVVLSLGLQEQPMPHPQRFIIMV